MRRTVHLNAILAAGLLLMASPGVVARDRRCKRGQDCLPIIATPDLGFPNGGMNPPLTQVGSTNQWQSAYRRNPYPRGGVGGCI